MSKFIVILLLGCLMVPATEALQGSCCHIDGDCSCGECCFVPSFIASRRDIPAVLPIAKLSRPSGGFGSSGTCQTLSVEGESCDVFTSCGCASGLNCNFEPATPQEIGANNTDSARLVSPGASTCTKPKY